MKKNVLKIVALLAACVMIVAGLAACGNSGGNTPAPAPSGSAGGSASAPASGKYVVGICQLVQHEALDAATKGFKDALIEELGKDAVTFDEQNASGDSATCATIVNGFVSDGVDLILANATPALQAAASATEKIPILGTSVTAYDAALNLKDFNGVVGGNISGTSDLAPLDQQAEMLHEIFPDVTDVGILSCSGEANSKYQVEKMTDYLLDLGYVVTSYTFTDSNDVQAVAQSACDSNNVIYIPTDNTAASNIDVIDAIARATNTPIVAGEEGILKGGGIVTLTIDYYELGKVTGQMAAKILKGEADISEMPIEYFPADKLTKEFNPKIRDHYDIQIPADYVEVELED